MTHEETTRVLAHLRAGAAFTVRNQDGWWGFRGGARGLVAWSRIPYEPDTPDRTVDDSEVIAAIGGWAFDVVCAHLAPPLGATNTDASGGAP